MRRRTFGQRQSRQEVRCLGRLGEGGACGRQKLAGC